MFFGVQIDYTLNFGTLDVTAKCFTTFGEDVPQPVITAARKVIYFETSQEGRGAFLRALKPFDDGFNGRFAGLLRKPSSGNLWETATFYKDARAARAAAIAFANKGLANKVRTFADIYTNGLGYIGGGRFWDIEHAVVINGNAELSFMPTHGGVTGDAILFLTDEDVAAAVAAYEKLYPLIEPLISTDETYIWDIDKKRTDRDGETRFVSDGLRAALDNGAGAAAVLAKSLAPAEAETVLRYFF